MRFGTWDITRPISRAGTFWIFFGFSTIHTLRHRTPTCFTRAMMALRMIIRTATISHTPCPTPTTIVLFLLPTGTTSTSSPTITPTSICTFVENHSCYSQSGNSDGSSARRVHCCKIESFASWRASAPPVLTPLAWIHESPLRRKENKSQKTIPQMPNIQPELDQQTTNQGK